MKITIAICDDEQKICAEVENILCEILEEISIKSEIDVFTSGESLCEEMERTKYDLLFLDIELPKMNGVEIGRYIRENLKNQMLDIAYISSKQEYAMELFDFRPINFLIKPLEKEKIKKVIDTYLEVKGKQENVFHYKIGFQHYKIEAFKILYFERVSRKVIMHSVEDEAEFYDSLEEIYQSLKKQGFLFIHKTYLINRKYIKIMAYDHVIMTDGTQLPISQSRRSAIRKAYMDMEAD